MTEKIAVFIDGDNISYCDVTYIMKEISNYGNINICNVYGDWSCKDLKKWLFAARDNGIITIQCDKISGKNSTDIKMCIDIMNVLYNIPHISLYYIVTSDNDFRHVISEIKKMNKKIHCIGSKYVNNSLVKICDKYTKIEILTKNRKKISTIKKSNNEIKNEILSILDDSSEEVNLSLIKDILQRKYNFDYREYGYLSMKNFIKSEYNDILFILIIDTDVL